MPKCKLCGWDFTLITASHLKHSHNMSTLDYLALFPQEEMRDKEAYSKNEDSRRQHISETWWNKSEDERSRIKEKLSEVHTGVKLSDETKRKISIASTENQSSLEYRLRHSTIMSEVMKETWKNPEYRALKVQQMSESSKRNWANPEYRKRTLEAQRQNPSKDEEFITFLIEEEFPNQWEHTGKTHFVGGGKRKPDWTHKTLKQEASKKVQDYIDKHPGTY